MKLLYELRWKERERGRWEEDAVVGGGGGLLLFLFHKEEVDTPRSFLRRRGRVGGGKSSGVGDGREWKRRPKK